MPMLINGMRLRMNHAQLKYILKELGTLKTGVNGWSVAKDVRENSHLRANVELG